MTSRRINFAFKSLAALFVVAAGSSLGTALLLPLPEAKTDDSTSAGATPTTNPASHRSLESFVSAWTAPLRQSLDELPASPDRPTLASDHVSAMASASAPVALVGTIGESLAMLLASDGSIFLKAVGESAGGAEVLAIRPFEVDLRVNGALTTLRKPAEASPSPSAREQGEKASDDQSIQ